MWQPTCGNPRCPHGSTPPPLICTNCQVKPPGVPPHSVRHHETLLQPQGQLCGAKYGGYKHYGCPTAHVPCAQVVWGVGGGYCGWNVGLCLCKGVPGGVLRCTVCHKRAGQQAQTPQATVSVCSTHMLHWHATTGGHTGMAACDFYPSEHTGLLPNTRPSGGPKSRGK